MAPLLATQEANKPTHVKAVTQDGSSRDQVLYSQRSERKKKTW
jgi:hypothetical protein